MYFNLLFKKITTNATKKFACAKTSRKLKEEMEQEAQAQQQAQNQNLQIYHPQIQAKNQQFISCLLKKCIEKSFNNDE